MTSLDPWTSDDGRWMSQALELAERAATMGEVPVGAVVVRDGMCLGEGTINITNHDPSAHAEMVALRAAARHSATISGQLPLYVTLNLADVFGAMVRADCSTSSALSIRVRALPEGEWT